MVYETKGSLDLSLLLPLGWPDLTGLTCSWNWGWGPLFCSPLELHLGNGPRTARAPTSDVPRALSSISRLTRNLL